MRLKTKMQIEGKGSKKFRATIQASGSGWSAVWTQFTLLICGSGKSHKTLLCLGPSSCELPVQVTKRAISNAV